MTQAKARRAWSYKCGERGCNRVRAYEDVKRAVIFLEFSQRDGAGRISKKRVSTRHADRARAKAQADEMAFKLRSAMPQVRSQLTLKSLFDIYVREVTPEKSVGKQRHDRATVELFCRCFGAERHPSTLNRRDWDKFIRERRQGRLRPPGRMRTSVEQKATGARPVRDQQVRYDLQFLLAVLNWATMVRDEEGASLLPHNCLRGSPLPREESPRRPMLSQAEIDAMLRVAPLVGAQFALALLLAVETGHRMGSIRLLQWRDVDLEQCTVRWRAESDKIGLDHTTPLSQEVVAALQTAALAKATGWVLPAIEDDSQPCPRRTLLKWWSRAQALAGIAPVPGLGYHSLRRRFANDLKTTNLRDLCGLGGWKSAQTVLTVYQQPELLIMREALDARTKRRMDSRNGQQAPAAAETANPAEASSFSGISI